MPNQIVDAEIGDVTTLVGAPTDPVLRAIGDNLVMEMRATALKALVHDADPAAFPLDADARLEQLFRSRFAAKPPDARQRATQRALAVANDPGRLQELGLGEVNLHDARAIVVQLGAQTPPALDPQRLIAAATDESATPGNGRIGLADDVEGPVGTGDGTPLRPIGPDVAGPIGRRLQELAKDKMTHDVAADLAADKEPTLGSGSLAGMRIYSGLNLRIRKLRCVDVTGGGGDDQIALGGIAMSANGTTHPIAPFTVSENFDNGMFVDFGAKTFAAFSYKADNTVTVPGKGTLEVDWPRAYFVTFLLAEVDNGGFPEFVQDLFNEVRQKAVAAVAAAVGAYVGGTALSEIPGLGTAIGAAVGALVGWVLGELWGAIVEWWEDDEFTPITVKMARASVVQRFKDGTADDSKNRLVWWKQHDGEYRLSFDWLVTR
jgi:hypothetical protein